MTDQEKKLEEQVFEQEVSQEELKDISGGEDCGMPSHVIIGCPGSPSISICPDCALEDMPRKRPGIKIAN